MPNLKDLKLRINSVKKTEQITKAMRMVAAAKLRRAQNDIVAARPYAIKMNEVLMSLVSRTNPDMHPLLKVREPKKAVVVVIASDRGLCGSFNQNIFRNAEKTIDLFYNLCYNQSSQSGMIGFDGRGWSRVASREAPNSITQRKTLSANRTKVPAGMGYAALPMAA